MYTQNTYVVERDGHSTVSVDEKPFFVYNLNQTYYGPFSEYSGERLQDWFETLVTFSLRFQINNSMPIEVATDSSCVQWDMV